MLTAIPINCHANCHANCYCCSLYIISHTALQHQEWCNVLWISGWLSLWHRQLLRYIQWIDMVHTATNLSLRWSSASFMSEWQDSSGWLSTNLKSLDNIAALGVMQCLYYMQSLSTLPSVMADCDGMSRAFSFRLCTYFIWSITGIRILRPCRKTWGKSRS